MQNAVHFPQFILNINWLKLHMSFNNLTLSILLFSNLAHLNGNPAMPSSEIPLWFIIFVYLPLTVPFYTSPFLWILGAGLYCVLRKWRPEWSRWVCVLIAFGSIFILSAGLIFMPQIKGRD